MSEKQLYRANKTVVTFIIFIFFNFFTSLVFFCLQHRTDVSYGTYTQMIVAVIVEIICICSYIKLKCTKKCAYILLIASATAYVIIRLINTTILFHLFNFNYLLLYNHKY